MTIEEFCRLDATGRYLVLRYLSVHTVYPYYILKDVADCLLGHSLYLVPPLLLYDFSLLLAEVPEDYANYPKRTTSI